MNRFLLLFAIGLWSLGAFAQKSDPVQYLEQIVDKYNKASSMEMNFSLVIEPVEQPEETYAGSFARKGDSYFMESELQTVYSDGKDAWIYVPDNQEVQIVDADEEAGLPTPQSILTRFYNDEYKQRSRPLENGDILYEFVPVDTEEEIYKVQLTASSTEKLIRKIKVFDRSADRYTIVMEDQRFDLEIPDEKFVFDESRYPGVYVEDLRLD